MPETTIATLVERERELATLDELLAEGGGRLALIEGPAGIGKTQLLAEARERAAGSMSVAVARASELEREFPFGVVRQLFEGLVADPERSQALSGAAQPAEAVFGSLGANGDAEGGVASFAVLHGLFWFSLNLAEERPLLLAIDDLQWCDTPSLRFVAYLARRLEGVPILIAATQRSTDPGTDPALLAEIAHDPLTVAVHPGALSSAGVHEVVRARLGDEAAEGFSEACHDSTGGNPLLLRQLLIALEADGVTPEPANAHLVRDIGPRAVSRTVLVRLARLPEETVAIARAVAVLGESAALPTVAALAQVDERRVAAATGELARAEILRPEPPLGFVHPLVRDAVYHELPLGERELLHARAAELLRDSDAVTDQIAAQLLHAPRRGEPWVAELLAEAGHAAKRRGAAESAVAYLARAVEEPPPEGARAELLLELGLAESLVSRGAAVDHLRGALELLEDPARRALAAHELARLLLFSEAPEHGLEVARRAAAEVPPDLPDERRRLEATQHMAVFFGAGDLTLQAQLEQYRGGVDAEGAGARMLEAMAAYSWTLSGGPVESCVGLAKRALAGGELIDRDDTFFVIAAQLVLVVSDREEAMPLWDEIQAAAHRRGSLFSVLGVHIWRGYTLFRRGDLNEAETQLREAKDENAGWGIVGGPGAAYVYGILGELLRERGKLDEAERLLAKAPELDGPTDGGNHVLRARVALLVDQRKPEEALAAALECERDAYVLNPTYGGQWRTLKALALDLNGRTDEAVALAEEEVELARRYGSPGAIGRSLSILGTLRQDLGRLQEAVDVLAPSSAKLEHAKALAALGSAIRRARKPSEAREPLRQALELASVCGAEGLAERARSELYATGARPRSDALAGVDALTPSELRVAQLAAGGESNKNIAQNLYVTPKTVEVHLSNAYRKLGIRSRRQLPGALAA
ncbi:MAG TPA: AAA family ATPase [Thermoleophilaceae bacterium]